MDLSQLFTGWLLAYYLTEYAVGLWQRWQDERRRAAHEAYKARIEW